MKSREEEIEAAKNLSVGNLIGNDKAFIAGAQWADSNPAPNVAALVEALEQMILAARDNGCGLRIADDALAAYHKATKGDESDENPHRTTSTNRNAPRRL